MLALMRHPAQMALLRARPELMADAVEEMLRYDGPTQAMTRIALEDFPIEDGAGGRRIVRRGDRVFALLNAANRDPQVFAEPDRFDATRRDNRHLSFGYGPHFCLGAPLARLEVQIGVAALLRRLPDLKIESDDLLWSDSFVLRGIKSLAVSFRTSR